MPVGTSVIDVNTEELIVDLDNLDQPVMVARGGHHGMGNTRFKSSINRAPRKTTSGTLGEKRTLQLQLRLVADVGLLGLPNAGKSTLIRSVSAAKPKVADYPFTTLTPNLGVVSLGMERSFTIADIPGLIEGASQGAGLGFRFLKHLSRTRLLLHLIDVLPADNSDPLENAKQIVQELEKFSPTLAKKERILVLNKIDLLPWQELEELEAKLQKELKWGGPIFKIAAINKQGCDALCNHLMESIELHRDKMVKDDGYKKEQQQLGKEMAFEIRRTIESTKSSKATEDEYCDEALDD